MNDENQPDPADAGNTIDGSRIGDGSGSRTDGTAGDTASGDSSADAAGAGADDAHAAERSEQKGVYRAPEQPDSALGGTEGTTDGS